MRVRKKLGKKSGIFMTFLTTTSKRWEKTTVPTNGTTVMVSGYIGGENLGALQVEVETMQFITPARGNEGAGLPRTPGRTRFGIPMGFVFLMLLHPPLLIYFCRMKGKANTSPRHDMFFICFFFTLIFF